MAVYIRSVMSNSVSNTVIIEFSNIMNRIEIGWTYPYTYTNKVKSSQFRYDSLCFENSIITVFDMLLLITDLIYATTPPPY